MIRARLLRLPAIAAGLAVAVVAVSANPRQAALAAAPASAPAATAAAGFPIESYLNVRSASSGTLSSDGARAAFLANITGFNQVWVVDAAGGWPDQITFFPDRVQWVQWSPVARPDGLSLALGKDAGGDERTQIFLASPDGGTVVPLTTSPRVIHTFGGWSPDGGRIAYVSNERDERFFDVYVMDVAARKAERVLQDDGNNSVAAWSPDGRALVIKRTPGSSDSDLFLLELASRKLTRLTPHEGKAEYAHVAWPPGDIIYLASDEGRDFMNVAAVDVRNPRVTFVEDAGHDVSALVFSRDGRRCLVAFNDDGFTRLSLREGGVRGREMKSPELPRGVAGGFEFSADGRLLLARVESSAEPGDIWLHDTAAGATRRVTRSSKAGLPAGAFVEPEPVSWTSFDGLRIPGLLYSPATPRPASGHPAVVWIHGGPESQFRPTFQPVIQFLVSRGYAVLAPNIRGSTGYGRRYHSLDNKRLRGDAIKDIAATAAWLKSSGRADGTRLAAMGGSYGGYMTLAALTFHPDLWAAGVDIVGISSFRSFLKNTGAWRQVHRASEYGDPVADADFLDSVSPLNFADRIEAPLIVVQGANDPRVPRTEAEQIVDNLKRRGRPVEYLLFDDEGHGVVKLGNRIKAYGAIAEFLDKHLGG